MHANNFFELITGNTYPVKDQIKECDPGIM
jgi:hypothetical protein